MIEEIKILSPGRICLYGDHQDYLGLPVIAAAINRHITISAKRNTKSCFRISMPNIKRSTKIKLDETEYQRPRDYFVSSLNVLRRNGFQFTVGYDIEITGNIPIRAGASSSSAIVAGWILFLTEIGENHIHPSIRDRAIWTYTAEVLEHNEPGGKMDQFTITLGDIIYINTVAEYDIIKLKNNLDGFVLANSKIDKDTIGLLSRVRGMQEQAIAEVKKINPSFSIFNSHRSDIEKYKANIDIELHPYFEAAVLNYHCTKDALDELQKPNINTETLASLMNEHHRMLKDNLKITVPIIDVIVEIALANGAYAAKINGSGGGGSVVIFAGENKHTVLNALKDRGFEAHDIEIDPGTRVIHKVES